jgi:hypothetical protein
VRDTQDGKDAYEESSQDFNIGDLIDHYQEASLQPFLDKEGVTIVSLTGMCADYSYTFDRQLVDYELL